MLAIEINQSNFIMFFGRQDGDALQFASEELKNDKEFVLKAVSQNGDALKHASEELKNDIEIQMKSKSYFRLPREIPNLFNINFKFK